MKTKRVRNLFVNAMMLTIFVGINAMQTELPRPVSVPSDFDPKTMSVRIAFAEKIGSVLVQGGDFKELVSWPFEGQTQLPMSGAQVKSWLVKAQNAISGNQSNPVLILVKVFSPDGTTQLDAHNYINIMINGS